ncbi:MAG: glutamate--cysteine ligase [Thiolinea sp.]
MYQQVEQRLAAIEQNQLQATLRESRTGLEKESLRVTPDSTLAQTDHPKVLGSALTHPWITTDYAESLIELITPPQARATETLDFLLDIETFVYQHLARELLWTTSMPCVLHGEDDIRIAEYGSSNAGLMKHVYRQGLAWRYGKTMQVIAGIHFNYSIAESFWEPWQQVEGHSGSLREFRDEQYMALTRNLLRYGWLVIYLFGTSPAICKSFLGGRKAPETMLELNEYTLYEPYGTSLRMGNIGYTNSKENESGVQVCYDSVQSYTNSLWKAIHQPSPEYAKIGVKVDGVYRQLNTNILQIENEYYSTVRPKQPLQRFEKPVHALQDRGIKYIELRSVDINAFHPAGLTHDQLRFLEVFMHFCLLQASPKIDANERQMINSNQMLVAHQGRKPQLMLQQPERDISLQTWGLELLGQMLKVADLLDAVHQETHYHQAVQQQIELVLNPELTPSAQMMAEMHEKGASFFSFAQSKSAKHRDFFLARKLSPERKAEFIQMAKESLEQQQIIEKSDKIGFDQFLHAYFSEEL